jgi:hypothetical protein
MEQFILGNTGLDPLIRSANDRVVGRFGHLNKLVNAITALQETPPGSGIQSVVAGTNVTVDDTDPLNPIVNSDTPTLQEVSDAGGLTNNSTIRQGTIDHGYGGGISRVCANNKDDQWEDGVRYLIHDSGGFKTVIHVENSNGTNPNANDDETLSYAVGSRWKNLVSGVEYICTQATESDAIWLPLQGDINDLISTSLTVDGSLCTNAEVVAFSYNISGSVITVFLKALLDFSLLTPNKGWFNPIIIEGTEPSAEGIFGTGSLPLSDLDAPTAFYSIVIDDGKAWCSGGGTGAANVPATITYSYIYTIK